MRPSTRTAVVSTLTFGLALSLSLGSGSTAASASRNATATAPTAVPGASGKQASEPGHADDGTDPTVGRWTVEPTGDGVYTITWTAPSALPVTDDRPVIESDGVPLPTPEIDADGRSVSVTVSADQPPSITGLDVTLSGRTLDAPVEQTSAPPAVVAPLPGTHRLSPDPGVAGAHPFAENDYRFPGVKLAGMPAKIEMLGHVVYPTNVISGAPLVLFLHGRHDYCYATDPSTGSGDAEWPCRKGTSPVPSYLGYRYVQRLLATQGFVTVSISANGINAQDWRLPDGGAAARATLIRRHLAAWADPTRSAVIGPAADAADLGDVVLVGHSRGGEGASRASQTIPLSAPYQISGQVLIGPTDFGRQTAAYIPTVTMLPYCDGDVSDLQGQTFTDVARGLRTDDTALHSSVLVMGANHNFFNTEWTPGLSAAPSFDDWFGDPSATCGRASDSRLTKAEQRAVGKAYIAGAVRLMARHDNAMLPLFDGALVTLASAGDTDVRSHAVGLDRQWRAPGHGASLAPSPTAQVQLCRGRAQPGGQFCGRGADPTRTPHWPASYAGGVPSRPAFEMTWNAAGQSGGMTFAQPLDVRGRLLHLRTIVAPGTGTAHLSVRVHDGSGHTDAVAVRTVPALPGHDGFALPKLWAQDLVLDPADLAARVDRADITRVDLVAHSTGGRVWVLEVAAGHDTLAPVPQRRAPVLSLDDASVVEGDALRTRYAQVPFHLEGDVSTPTTFVITSLDFATYRSRPALTVHVPAGVSSGSVRVPYLPNRHDDSSPRVIQLSAYAVSGAMPADYVATLKIIDDDPTPKVAVRTSRRVIREGWVSKWTVTLSRPVGYFASAIARIEPGPDRTDRLRVGDVPASWLRAQHLPRNLPANRPLDRLPIYLVETLEPGDRTVAFTIPTRADRQHEGREHVTLRIRVEPLGARATRTVQVVDRGVPLT